MGWARGIVPHRTRGGNDAQTGYLGLHNHNLGNSVSMACGYFDLLLYTKAQEAKPKYKMDLDMGLFAKLKKDKQAASGASCPHCNTPLDLIPERKKKCPSCGQYIFVRTRPPDRQRILVTEQGAKRIDDEWAKIREEKSKAIRAEIKAANRASLRRYKKEGMTHVELYPAPDACEECVALAGVYPITKVPLLPISRCRNPKGCRCTYLPVIE